AFDTFVFPDGMVGSALETNFGSEIDGSFGQNPAAEGEGRDTFLAMAEEAGFDGSGAFSAEGYDAAALILLAMAKAGSSDPAEYKDHVFDVANAPGEEILPGQLARALEILNEGGDVDYVGATAVELVGTGESAGSFREIEFRDGKLEVVGFR
ncbi:MAG: branched-chain amino acid ABC transporter substrate-binding protein, partial [Paracoccus sp. (in: a-proteobacteria)]|nr:branched-chain amino acid ABC transporter substrate-binding protein [Paracoccus sp. (in: a-proteobacteria)]